jgi:hypothetical protein
MSFLIRPCKISAIGVGKLSSTKKGAKTFSLELRKEIMCNVNSRSRNCHLLGSIKVKIEPRTGSACSANNFSFEMLMVLACCQCRSQVLKQKGEKGVQYIPETCSTLLLCHKPSSPQSA